jgi:hypothetical protein
MYALQTPLQTRHPLRIVRSAFLAFLITAGVTSGTADAQKAPARGSKPAGVAKSGPTTVIMFDMIVGGTYSIKKNGTDLSSVDAGPFGVLTFHDVTSTGDIFQIMWTGDNPVKPSTLTGLTASGTDVGCANISWNTPDPGDYVYEYVLAWGPSPGTFTDSTVVNTSSVSSQGGTSTYIHCGLPDGRYCFTIRAHNLYDMWSAYTAQACADVTNGSTQGPAPPQGVAVSQTGPGCATVTWNAVSDPSVSGYRVYHGQQSSTYTDSVDAGQATSRKICSLAEGTHYFAVKSYTGGGVNSVFSVERAVTISNRPAAPQNVAVSETDFGCAAISWDAAGGLASGYKVYYGDQSGVYVDSLNVGDNTNAEICGFSEGTYYFAVKSYASAGDHSDFSTERSLAMAGIDDQAPTVSSMNPADGEPDVELNRSIRFVLADDKTGIDRSSVTVTVNGAEITNVGFVGDPSSYNVVAKPAADFAANTTIDVSVTVSDQALPPNQRTASWSFDTGDVTITDNDPPVFASTSPADRATNVAEDAEIRVNVTDSGLGIDLGRIEFYVDDNAVTYTTGGDAADLTLIYENTDGFAEGATVNVRLVVFDQADNRKEKSFSFTVKSDLASIPPSDMGQIVPNGYWASDPSRPLEVRNLPMSWTVRIFDTVGRSVRNYSNNTTDGADWMWDFNNDHGQRVARALYLVRVTDPDGKVRQSGRFLVQSDP